MMELIGHGGPALVQATLVMREEVFTGGGMTAAIGVCRIWNSWRNSVLFKSNSILLEQWNGTSFGQLSGPSFRYRKIRSGANGAGGTGSAVLYFRWFMVDQDQPMVHTEEFTWTETTAITARTLTSS